jgi:Zn-dependent M32 family carboxypeptidase
MDFLPLMRKTLRQDLPGAEAGLARGALAPVLGWLRERVQVRGSLLRADDLCRETTDSLLRVEPCRDYLNAKFGELYGANVAGRDRVGSP